MVLNSVAWPVIVLVRGTITICSAGIGVVDGKVNRG